MRNVEPGSWGADRLSRKEAASYLGVSPATLADSGDVDRAFRGSGSRTLALGAGLIVSTPSDPLASSKRG